MRAAKGIRMHRSWSFLFIACLLMIAVLNVGTIRKKDSAVSKTQTAGIKLKDKLEELKDGQKGPATPTYGWYGGKNDFMGEPPFSDEAPESEKKPPIPEVLEVNLPYDSQDSREGDDSETEGMDWGGDWVGESFNGPEALPAEADNQEDSVFKEAAARSSDTSSDDEASKWDKDWWDEI